jgi:hypothetical protein
VLRHRHCEEGSDEAAAVIASEAKQSIAQRSKEWLASSQGLLAMTLWVLI